MKTNILFSLFIISAASFAQTQVRTVVPGTKYSMVPPTGLALSSSFTGFENTAKDASIILMELPVSYDLMKKSFDTERLKSKGMEVVSNDSITFDNEKARFIKIRQTKDGSTLVRQTLLFPKNGKAEMISGSNVESNKTLTDGIKAALLSAQYDEKQVADPEAAAHFAVEVSGTDFKFENSSGGILIYIDTDSNASFIVGKASVKNPVTDKKQKAIELLHTMPNNVTIKIESNEAVTINNLQGYEIIASSKNPSLGEQLTYQLALYDDNNNYYTIVGYAPLAEKVKYTAIFQKIAKSFHRQ
jgi:hypothetical protein